MSGNVLTPDAVAALVSAAREGNLPEEKQSAPARSRRLRSVDFTRPTKFSSDQERRLGRALDTFCRTASSRLSAELRVPLEFEVINSSQLTWANAHAQIPPSSIAASVEVEPLGTRMLLSAELSLVLASIERLLGGASATPPPERRLTEIDWVLARHLFDTLLAQLSIIFTDLADVRLALGGLDTPMECAQVAPVSEPTLTLSIEARMGRNSSTVVLLIPWAAIAPVASAIAGREDEAEGDGEEAAVMMHAALSGVGVTLRAEVAGIELPIADVLALRPGDVVRLGAPAAGGVTVYADETAVHRAKPGRAGARRAVQIVGPSGEGP